MEKSQRKVSRRRSAARQNSGFSLKDDLFNQDRVQYLATLFHTADSRFDKVRFTRSVMRKLQSLELKERIEHIARVLESHLDSDFRKAARQIMAALPPPLDPQKTDNDFGDFIFAPLGEYVARHGVSQRNLKLSLQTLRELTQRFSMEDAIRTFLEAYPDETMATLEKWASHKNYHVRRLVSEGTRPLLPWSKRISLDVCRPLPLLQQLHADPTRYVTRSVCNHLNDLAKSHPSEVLKMLEAWKQVGLQDEQELRWMYGHALRTLVKRGDSQALRFLGFRPQPKITVEQFTIHSPRIRPGEAIEFSVDITAARQEPLIVDYVVDFVKANGTLAPKVHKLKQVTLRKGQTVTIRKKHPLRANATTYSLYPGTHYVTLQINGRLYDKRSFLLL